jgi:hypothetical protein
VPVTQPGGGAPEDVLRVQIEREPAGCVMHHGGAMHMDRPFRRTRGAAGEMQEGGIVPGRRHDREVVARLGHQSGQIERAGNVGGRGSVLDDQHMLERTELRTDGLDLTLVERRRRKQHLAPTHVDSGPDRFRTEGGKQRGRHKARLESAQHADIEFRNPARQHEQAFALGGAQLRQDVGEAVGSLPQLGIRDVLGRIFTRQPAQRGLVPIGTGRMAVDRFVRDVETATGQSGEFAAQDLPREPATRRFDVGKVWRYALIARLLANDVVRRYIRQFRTSQELSWPTRVLSSANWARFQSTPSHSTFQRCTDAG